MTTLKQMIAEKEEDARIVDENGDCHRIVLWRTGDPFKKGDKYLNFIMINPSKADEKENDPTINKCIIIAKDKGCNGIIVTNLFTVVETDVKKLFDHNSTNLKYSDDIIREAAELSQHIVCAWGLYAKAGKSNSELVRQRSNKVIDILKTIKKTPECLGKNKTDGSPKHPLYVRKDKKLDPFN